MAHFKTTVLPEWENAMRKWEQCYYCGRCDGVFIPQQSSLIPIAQMHEFLYRP